MKASLQFMTSNLIDSILFVLDFGTQVSTTRIRKYAFIDDSQCLLESYTMVPFSVTKVQCTYTKSSDKSLHSTTRYTISDSSKRLEVTVTLGPLDGQIKVTSNGNLEESSAFIVSRSQTLNVSELFDMPQALSLSIACGINRSCFASVPGQPESLFHLNIESLSDSNALMYMKTMARCLMQPLRYKLTFIEPCVSYLNITDTVQEVPNEMIIVWTHSGRQLKATCFANKSFVIRVNSVDIGPDNGIDCSLFTNSVSRPDLSKVATNAFHLSSKKKQSRLY
jgi:hypothetical protein